MGLRQLRRFPSGAWNTAADTWLPQWMCRFLEETSPAIRGFAFAAFGHCCSEVALHRLGGSPLGGCEHVSPPYGFLRFLEESGLVIRGLTLSASCICIHIFPWWLPSTCCATSFGWSPTGARKAAANMFLLSMVCHIPSSNQSCNEGFDSFCE